MQHLSDIGLVDASGGFEIAHHIEAPTGWHRVYGLPMSYAENIVRAMPQAVEVINRTVSALAAYRLMYARTKDHTKSMQYAADVVDETQGNYSANNTAPVFNTKGGRLLLQFRKYGQMIVALMAKNVRRAVMGGAAGERRKGMATMAYILASQQIMAGTMGLPWEPVKFAMMALRALGLTDDDWDDFHKMIEDWWAWLTGSEKAGEVLTHGVSRGIPFGLDFDLSSRVGMDSLLTFGEPRSGKDADIKAWLLDTVAGAAVGTVYDIGSGVSDIMAGKYEKGLPKLIPFKTVSDAVKAANGGTGLQTPQQKILRTIGFTPGEKARDSERVGREISTAQRAKDKRNALISDYISARSAGDVAKLTGRIREYNSKLPKDSRDRISMTWVEKKRREEYAR